MASVHVMVTSGSQLSIAVANPVLAGSVGWSHWTVAFGGQTIAGGVVSHTLMSWTHVAALPQSSVAVHVRKIV
jgi:hypothetical protein